jgi:hypothetical protein
VSGFAWWRVERRWTEVRTNTETGESYEGHGSSIDFVQTYDPAAVTELLVTVAALRDERSMAGIQDSTLNRVIEAGWKIRPIEFYVKPVTPTEVPASRGRVRRSG